MQASGRIEPGSMRVVAGEELLKGWYAGSGLEKVFCSACGGHVLARDKETGAVAVVRLGAIDGDPGVRPAAHQFADDAPIWAPIPDDGLPRFPERIPVS